MRTYEKASRPAATAEKLAAELRRKPLPAGARLAPLRHLATEYGVSYVTMQKAIRRLHDEGLVEVRPGDGVFVVGGAASQGSGVVRPAIPQTHAIGIVQRSWSRGFGAAAIQRIVHGLLEAVDPHGWEVKLIHATDHELQGPDFPHKAAAMRIDGIAWLRPGYSQQMNMMRLIDRGIQVVACGRRFERLPIPTSSEDYADAAEKIMAWCVAHGKREAAVLGGPIDGVYADPYAVALCTEIEAAAQRHGMHLPGERICQAEGLPGQDRLVRSFVQAHPEVEAFICPFYNLLIPLCALAREGCWQEPARIAVFDLMYDYALGSALDLSAFLHVPVLNPLEEMGRGMARCFEETWLGEAHTPEPDLSVRLGLETGLALG